MSSQHYAPPSPGYLPLIESSPEPEERDALSSQLGFSGSSSDASGYFTDDGLAPPAPTVQSVNSHYTKRSKDEALVFARSIAEDKGISEIVSTRSGRWASGRLETYFVHWAFFCCGMATAIVWNLFLTLYPFFEQELDTEVLLWFLAGYNLPGVPVLLMQARCDRPIDRRVGSKPAYLLRICICMAVLLAIVLGFPFLDRKFPLLIGTVIVIGFIANIMYGSLFQLVTFFPAKSVTFLYLGNGFSSIISLIFTVSFGLLHNVANCTSFQLFCMFYACGGVVCLSMIMFLLLMNTNMSNGAMELKDMLERDEDLEEEERQQLGVPSLRSSTSGCGPTLNLMKRIRFIGLSLLVNMLATVLAASFFNRVPEQDLRTGELLSYVYIIGDVVGRQFAILLCCEFSAHRGGIAVFVSNLIRAGFCAAWIVYAFIPFFDSDVIVLVFCSVFFVTGGFLNSVAYSLVRGAVAESRLLTKAAALLNLLLQCGSVIAVLIAYCIKMFLPLPDHLTPSSSNLNILA